MIRAHGNKAGTGKHEIIALENSFHGRTLGALSITGQPKYRHDFEPLLPGVRFVPNNNLEALEAAFSESTAGMVLELIQGEGGIYPVSPAFAQKARELADRYNALLVFDEIQCGVGKPGTYFAYQRTKPRSGDAGYRRGGQTSCLRLAARRHRGKRESRRSHRPRDARIHFRRQRAFLPRGA